jgi:hypothetical protein
MPARRTEPTIQVDPLDIESKSMEERIQMALAAIARNRDDNEKQGENWVRRFRTRHPDLRAKWTTGQEKCRAGAFNQITVMDFYDEYDKLVNEYNIKPENIYNVDEKGCQLGIGAKIKALIDRNQKDAQLIEDGE